eukprot:3392108-Pleurochrysis_carterae.AAC.1
MSPTRKQRTAPLRTLVHLATVRLTSCVDAIAVASAHANHLHMLLLAVFFAIFNSLLLNRQHHTYLSCVSCTIPRSSETHATAVASVSAIAITVALAGPSEA